MTGRRWTIGLPAAAVALAAGAFATFASAGGSPPPDRSPHLLVVPTTPQGKAALAVSAARTVAGYRAFTLVEATGDDVARLQRAGASVRDDMREVKIGTRTVDPSLDRPTLASKAGGSLRTAGKGGSGLAVVQYVGPLKDEWTAAVAKSGVEVVSYMAQNGQLVAGDDAALARLAELQPKLAFVRAVTPFTAADKALPGLAKAGRTKVVISTVKGDAGADARAAVRAASDPEGEQLTVANFTQQRVSLDAAKLAGLTALGGVVAVEPAGEPKLLDERAATIVAGRVTTTFQPLIGNGYRQFLADNGFGQSPAVTVDITDEGVDKGVTPAPAGSHPDFFRLGATTQPSRIMYDHEATALDADARDCGGHGTNVASIATGYNRNTGATDEDAGGFNYGLGIAPYARLGASKIFNCAGDFDVTTSITDLHNQAYASGARISNNSWGSASGGAYTSRSQEFDGIVRDAQPGVAGNQGFVEVVSAGNSGAGANTTGAPGTAKNVITVGASENARQIGATDGCGVSDSGANSARDIIDFSSRGPTDDGRIKPDIVAPGTHVSGAQPQTGADFNGSGTCNPQFPAGSLKYTLVSGTSQAAPEVTGFAALLREWFPSHLGGGAAPSPAMTKALMANTATDLAGGDDGAGATNGSVPTQVQGWGRINLGTVLDGTSRQARDQKTVFKDTGNSSSLYYGVASAAKPVRVTLAWTDAVGPTVGDSFVNDLDLEVTAAGQTFKGNVLSGGRSVAGGTADPRNNLENVLLPAGVTGTIKVRVIARNIAGDGIPGNADTTDQDFALVVSNAGASSTTGAVLTEGTRTVTPGGDGDAYLERGEPFTVRQGLRNAGNAGATGISGALTSGAGATITTGAATWPNLASNASGNNTPLFAATVSPTAACGAPLALTVTANSSAGQVQIPFSVLVGKPSTNTITRNATDVPKAIPDDNDTGVTSALAANTLGSRVSDLNVSIGQITHTFDADLVIRLTSPQGTTVTLASGNGGSGDNFTSTVFDDEAATTIIGGAAPFTGSFRPVQPLSAFDGQTIGGTWTLRVIDTAGDDIGTLSSWGTATRGYAC